MKKTDLVQQVLDAELIIDCNGKPVWPETQEEFLRVHAYIAKNSHPSILIRTIMVRLSPEEAVEAVRLKRAAKN